MKRQSSTIGIAHILVIVVIADAAQDSFAEEYPFTEGIVLVLTIVFWDTALNLVSYRFKPFERPLAAAPMPLIEHGKLNRHNMRREFITEDELRSHLAH